MRVADLLAQAVAELASGGPTIALLDEVEMLAVDRSKLSMDTNPIDLNRTTGGLQESDGNSLKALGPDRSLPWLPKTALRPAPAMLTRRCRARS